MPIFYFGCRSCGRTTKMLLGNPDDALLKHLCPHCNTELIRTPKAPSTQVVETLDNGLMTKRVEQLKDVAEMMQQRNDKDYRDEDPES